MGMMFDDAGSMAVGDQSADEGADFLLLGLGTDGDGEIG
jgi:hypothetical protein